MADDVVIAIGLLLVIEGILYALFPEGMKRMMSRMTKTPAGALREARQISVARGRALVWLVRG